MLTNRGDKIILCHGVFTDAFFKITGKKSGRSFVILEGRPFLDGAKISTKQFLSKGIRPTLIADNMAGFLFYKNLVREVWLSYQEKKNNVAVCAIGGLILAVLARRHNVPVYLSTSGLKRELLGRPKDLFYFNGKRVAALGVKAYVPLVEDVPLKYITETIL